MEHSRVTGYLGRHAVADVTGNPRASADDPDTKTCNALLRSLRYQGERGVAPMTQRWRCLQRVTLSPSKIGDIARSARVLVLFEHKMLT